MDRPGLLCGKGTILKTSADGTIHGPGHHSILQEGDDYYIVYHRHPLNDDNGHHRYTCIDRMTFDAEGKINPVRITLEGVEPQTISR